MRKMILSTAILTFVLLAGCGKPAEEPAEPQQTPAADSQAPEPQQSEFSFADLADRTFIFCSGVGAWQTELYIHDDGTFHGLYVDSDMGDCADAYPDGTRYVCEYTGAFDNLEKIDDFTYQMKMISLTPKQEPETEELADGVRYIYSDAYGLEGGDIFYLYLPGSELANLPEGYLGWVGYYNLENTEETELPYYGLYNVNTADGFSSYEYEEQSLSERIAMEISFAEERAAELEEELQTVSSQTDMNFITNELFQTWDDTLNIVWKLLAAELDDSTMDALTIEEKNWIDDKEAKAAAAGLEYEGGSMQPMVQAMTAAELTKERVYELAKYAE